MHNVRVVNIVLFGASWGKKHGRKLIDSSEELLRGDLGEVSMYMILEGRVHGWATTFRQKAEASHKNVTTVMKSRYLLFSWFSCFSGYEKIQDIGLINLKISTWRPVLPRSQSASFWPLPWNTFQSVLKVSNFKRAKHSILEEPDDKQILLSWQWKTQMFGKQMTSTHETMGRYNTLSKQNA